MAHAPPPLPGLGLARVPLQRWRKGAVCRGEQAGVVLDRVVARLPAGDGVDKGEVHVHGAATKREREYLPSQLSWESSKEQAG